MPPARRLTNRVAVPCNKLEERQARRPCSDNPNKEQLKESIDSMSKIIRVEVFQVDLKPQVQRGDAIQSFHKQETPMVRLYADDDLEGTGYTYTIGTGGSSVVALIRDHLGPQLLGRDPAMVEQIWKDL